MLHEIEVCEHRARTAEDRMRAVAARYHEDFELLEQLNRSAPFVPRIGIAA